MAAFSHDTDPPSRGERFQLLRELGSRAVPIWAVLEALPNSRTKLVVGERVSRGGRHSDQDIADWVRDARRLATLEHPNVARVRNVLIRAEDVVVVSDFIDGVRWSVLMSSAQPPSLEVALRVLVDVLSGLSAVHNLRDAKREPLKLTHGELTPEYVLVGVDGVARVVGTQRMRAAAAGPGTATSPYLAPEVLLADDTADARADVYSVGAMLWEALSGRALFANTQPSAIVTQILSGRVPRAAVPTAIPWAAPLADVAARALAPDPAKRFGSAAAFAAELRRIVGPKLSPTVRVAALVRAAYGDEVRARREKLEGGASPRGKTSTTEARSEHSEHAAVDVPIDVAIEVDRGSAPPPSGATTRPPPPASPAAVPGPLRVPPLPSRVASSAQSRANGGASKLATPTVAGVVSRAPLPPPKLPPPRSLAAGPPLPPVVPLVATTTQLVPTDLVIATGETAVTPVDAVQPTSPPPRRQPRMRMAAALVAGPAVLVAIGLIWWAASRTPERTPERASPLPPAPSSTAEAQYRTTIVEAPAESLTPAPTPSADIAATATAGATTDVKPEATLPTRPASIPAARPVVRQKYDPQGI